MPSELWKFNDWTRWFCEIDKRVWTAHTNEPYTFEVAHVGCHARWRTPENFRKGLVCEFGFGDEAYMILADLLPDEIYYPAWNKIKARVTPELLTGQIELVYPSKTSPKGFLSQSSAGSRSREHWRNTRQGSKRKLGGVS
jgi:hypothetical protein